MSTSLPSPAEALEQWGSLTEDQHLDVCTEVLKKPFDERTKDDLSLLIKFTEQIPFFKGLTAKAHRECCNYLTFYFAEAEEVIMKEGDYGNTFYIILQGSVGVYRYSTKPDSNSQRKRRSSQFLTERNDPGSKESDPRTRLQLPASSLMKLDDYINTGSKQIDNTSKEYIPSINKDKSTVEQTMNVINGATLKKEKKILEEISVSRKGATFGERVLLSTNLKAKRKATIITKEPTYFACLEKQYFDLTLKEREEKIHSDNINFLQGLNYFKTFSYHLIEQIYYLAKRIKYRKNQVVYNEGDSSDNIYIINDGQFKLMKAIKIEDPNAPFNPNADINSHNSLAKKAPSKNGEIAIFGRGEMFGQYEIMKSKPRRGTIICESHFAEAYVLSRSIFTGRLYNEPHFRYFIDKQEQLKTQVYTQRLENISAQTQKNKNLLLRVNNSEKKAPQSPGKYKRTSFFEANLPSDEQNQSTESAFKSYENFASAGSLSSTKEGNKGMAAQIFKQRLSVVIKDNSILKLPLSQQHIKRYSVTAANSPENIHKKPKAKTYFDFGLKPRIESDEPHTESRNSNAPPSARLRSHSKTIVRKSQLFATEGSRVEKSFESSYGLNSAGTKMNTLPAPSPNGQSNRDTPILIQNSATSPIIINPPTLDQPLDQNFILFNYKNSKKSSRNYSPVSSQHGGKVLSDDEGGNMLETLPTNGTRRKSIFGPQVKELKGTEILIRKHSDPVPSGGDKKNYTKTVSSINPGNLFLRKTSDNFRPQNVDSVPKSPETFMASKSPEFIKTAERFFRSVTNEDLLPQIPNTKVTSVTAINSPKFMSTFSSPKSQGRSRPKMTINPLKKQNFKQEALHVQNFMEYKLTGKIKTFNPPLKSWLVHVRKSSVPAAGLGST